MIESIQITGVATYSGTPEALNDLSTFNYIYGSNGSGKTTISRIIADDGVYPTCKVVWKNGTKLQTMVYNSDFVKQNFNQTCELKGIFTLGKKHIDNISKIATANSELSSFTCEIEKLNLALQGNDGAGGKKGEVLLIEEEFKRKCWAQKQKYDTIFKVAFEGFRGSSEKFKEKILQENCSNSAMLLPLGDLEKKSETVFGSIPTMEQIIPSFETKDLVAHENNTILKKRVIGRDDVDISAMIKKLGNSDWVRGGRTFLESNEKVCPFCQRIVPDSFVQSLNEYFDETFETNSKAINNIITDYKSDAERFQQQIGSIIAASYKFLEIEKLKAEKELLDSRILTNIQWLALKKKEPSKIVEMESISNIVSTIKNLIDTANTLATNHNQIVKNLDQERRDLTNKIWKYLIDNELKNDLVDYKKKRGDCEKAIDAITAKIKAAKIKIDSQIAEISKLEKDSVSIQPTIDDINMLLSSFGCRGFSLAKSDNGICYKLVRPDGTDAKETLSEGEKAFVTFLYFYHLLKGSDSETGMTTDRVVVFDDPVSSLDSDILFIVVSLIKGLFEEVRTGTGHIKQVFVLTHNVYFHKEVTFKIKHRDTRTSGETFWVVRKSDLRSKIVKHNSNPIKTSYKLLWAEVRRPDRSNLAIQNTLRRIIDHYFKILGEFDIDSIHAKFDGTKKLICRSLLSWINDGSHSAHDDLYHTIDSSIVDIYLKVFKEIFDKSGHIAHYKMMMGSDFAEELTPLTPILNANQSISLNTKA